MPDCLSNIIIYDTADGKALVVSYAVIYIIRYKETLLRYEQDKTRKVLGHTNKDRESQSREKAPEGREKTGKSREKIISAMRNSPITINDTENV